MGLPEDSFLNQNEDTIVESHASSERLNVLDIDFKNSYVSNGEKLIPAEHHSGVFDVERGRSYMRRTVLFHLPFSGDPAHFKLQPRTRLTYTPMIQVKTNEILIEIVDFSGNIEVVKKEYANELNSLTLQYGYLKSELDEYNGNLSKLVRQIVSNRKMKIERDREDLMKLGLPMMKTAETAETFAVTPPEMRAKIKLVARPETVDPVLIPTLSNTAYEEIVSRIIEIGREFERLPATFSGKSEEDLRDHILANLAPSVEGSITGETFNKSGKTDILVRHGSQNVFAAECKFWTGGSAVPRAVDQLLSYLTWRDSRSALIFFVKNKQVSNVLVELERAISKHPNFLEREHVDDQSLQRYVLSLQDDSEMRIKCTVMVFHIPRS